MTSHGIAQRLSAKHGQETAAAKVQDKLADIRSTTFSAGDVRFLGKRRMLEALTKHTARKMLWTSVLHHLTVS
jgi:hypothetical protein